MKLAHWHRSLGDTVTLTRYRRRDLFDPHYDKVYASAIFSESQKCFPHIVNDWPDAIIGGTGSRSWQTVESIIGHDYEFYDYQDYPDYQPSIGFTIRGCQLNCKFCVVPQKEGKPYPGKLDQPNLPRTSLPEKTSLTRQRFFRARVMARSHPGNHRR